MCFGQESADYRVEAFPAYHADRPPMPDPLAHQWERAPALYEALGWKVMSHDELEADDLMHSLCAAEVEAGGTALHPHGRPRHVPVRDRQRPRADAARPPGGPDDMGPDEVLEAYGVTPEQVPDFIALRGDPSDGLPGAKGIGAKTAADLLKRKGDLEHVILGADPREARGAPRADRAGRRAALVPRHRDAAHGRGRPARPTRRPTTRAARPRRRSSAWAGSPSASRTPLAG